MNWITVFFPSDKTSAVIHAKKCVSSGKFQIMYDPSKCKVLFDNQWFDGLISGRHQTKKDAENFLKLVEGKKFLLKLFIMGLDFDIK